METGTNVDIKEIAVIRDGKKTKERGRCAEGWLTLNASNVERLEVETLPRGRRSNGEQSSSTTRRMSVSVDGVGPVASMAEQTAKMLGVAAEKVFNVRQETGKKREKQREKQFQQVQLKIGGMGISVFLGPNTPFSIPYVKILKWKVNEKDQSVIVLLSDDEKTALKFWTNNEHIEIAELMKRHAKMIAQERALPGSSPSHSPRAIYELAANPLAPTSEEPVEKDDEETAYQRYRALRLAQLSTNTEQGGNDAAEKQGIKDTEDTEEEHNADDGDDDEKVVGGEEEMAVGGEVAAVLTCRDLMVVEEGVPPEGTNVSTTGHGIQSLGTSTLSAKQSVRSYSFFRFCSCLSTPSVPSYTALDEDEREKPGEANGFVMEHVGPSASNGMAEPE